MVDYDIILQHRDGPRNVIDWTKNSERFVDLCDVAYMKLSVDF